MRYLSTLAVFALLLAGAGCPGADTPPATPPGGNVPGTNSNDPIISLTETLHRLEGRLAQYRAERPETPDIDRADGLLKDADAALKKVDRSLPQDEFMLEIHKINTMFYNFELLLPPLDAESLSPGTR